MGFEFLFRLVGMTILAIGGAFLGVDFASVYGGGTFYMVVFAATGALMGLILTPYLTTRPMRSLRSTLGRIAAETLFAGLIGLVSGLIIAALLSSPLSMLPGIFGDVAPFLGVLLFAYLGVSIFVMRQADIMGMISAVIRGGETPGETGGGSNWAKMKRTILLDTSVIIDGRIADIASTGFLPGTLLILVLY